MEDKGEGGHEGSHPPLQELFPSHSEDNCEINTCASVGTTG